MDYNISDRNSRGQHETQDGRFFYLVERSALNSVPLKVSGTSNDMYKLSLTFSLCGYELQGQVLIMDSRKKKTEALPNQAATEDFS